MVRKRKRTTPVAYAVVWNGEVVAWHRHYAIFTDRARALEWHHKPAGEKVVRITLTPPPPKSRRKAKP